MPVRHVGAAGVLTFRRGPFDDALLAADVPAWKAGLGSPER